METGNNLSDAEFDTFDDGTTRSRMAREAKIGMGVIFILLIVFGIVLYSRLPTGDDTSAAEAEAEAAGSETEDSGKPAADPLETGPSLADPSRPTFLEAKVGSAGAGNQAPSSDPDPWRMRTAESFAPKSNSGTADASSSSIRDLVPVKPADRYAGYRGSPTGGDASAGWASEQSSGGIASAESRPYASFASPATQAGSGNSQSAAPVSPESAGPVLLSNEANLPSPPVAQPTSAPYRWSTEAINPPKQQTDPEPTYATNVPSSDPTQQIGVAAGGAASGDTSRQWTSGGAAAQTAPNSTYASPQTSLLGSLGRQDAGRATTGKDGTYVVQPGDSYWVISERLYGTSAYFRALEHHNRAKTPEKDRLQMGDTILAPDVAELEQAYPDMCPKPEHREATQRRTILGSTQSPTGTERVYVVQQGDNLFDIARYELGKATRWTEIVDLNKQLLGSDLNDLNYLTPGMKLILPRDEPSAPGTQRSGSLYQR